MAALIAATDDDMRPAKRARLSPSTASVASSGHSDHAAKAGLSLFPYRTPTPTPSQGSASVSATAALSAPAEASTSAVSAEPTGSVAPRQPPAPVRPPKLTPSAILAHVYQNLSANEPTSTHYIPALRAAYQAFTTSQIVRAPDDTPELDCKLWLTCADVGIMVLDSRQADWEWAVGVEDVVERAVGKGLVLVQKNSTLRRYRVPLTLLHARLASHQGKQKFALTLLRKLISSFAPSDPPAQRYAAQLALISHLLASDDIDGALTALEDVQEYADANGHTNITALCKAERLRVLACDDRWELVPDALEEAEHALGLDAELPKPQPKDEEEEGTKPEDDNEVEQLLAPLEQEPATPHPDDGTPWHSALALPTLVLGVLAHTYAGAAKPASVRLAALHRRMDRGDGRALGLVRVPLAAASTSSTSGPDFTEDENAVLVQTTHASVLFRLTFLVSAASKRDHLSMGTAGEPKRRLFAREGLAVADKDTAAVAFAPGATLRDARDLDATLARVRADLLCEMVAVAVGRWEIAEAEDRLAQLIAHLRNAGLWDAYAVRVCLHQGHLAHALLRPARAAACYRLAARLAGADDDEVGVAARACDVALRLGWEAAQEGNDEAPVAVAPKRGKKRKRASTIADPDAAFEGALTRATPMEAAEVVALCARPGTSAALQAVGLVIAACTSTEVLRIKQHLKAALELASDAADNALRAPILALASAQYAHTAAPHAHLMLRTARKIARELGGAGALGAWIAARLVELYKRMGPGKEDRAAKAAEELLAAEAQVRALRERRFKKRR
ncbi:hypothetical protein AURDEDRAFT_172047 [Auricularia subglabra TFB-10046 SS5]|nr:hypothetical protein AURDEDRAFT_172047 [Auricularia subglabra TFB-10046 SS5]